MNSLSTQRVDSLSNYISNTFTSVQKNVSFWMESNDVTSFLKSSDVSEDIPAQMKSGLINLCTIDDNYRNAYLYVPAQKKLYRAFSESNVIDYTTIQHSAALQEIERTWQLYSCIYPYGTSPASLASVVTIRDNKTGAFLGFCMLKISTLYLSNTFNLSSQAVDSLYCINSAGKIAYTNDNSMELPFTFDSSIANTGMRKIGNYSVYCRRINNSDLFILSVAPTQFWMFESTRPFLLGIIVSLIVITVSISITIHIVRRLLIPIRSLADTMETNDPNNLKPVKIEGRTDEIGTLRQTYNNMIKRINEMIETQYRSDLLLKDTQLRALQFQINPHFVNNTLQMINQIAVDHDMYEISDLLYAFSRMFDYTLRFKSGVVALSEELTYLKHYILLQEHRFPNKFILNFDIDEDTKNLDIPIMTLQPILENTFRYSFLGISRKISVTIFTALCKDCYKIIIEDDGCGIDPQMLKAIKENLSDLNMKIENTSAQTSIGLKNVNSRIRLLYGDAYGITINSEPDNGTTVMILLPV